MAGTLTPELLLGKGAGLKPTESGLWTRSRANFCESNGGLAFSPTDLGCDLNPVLNLERIFTPDLLQPVSGETSTKPPFPGRKPLVKSPATGLLTILEMAELFSSSKQNIATTLDLKTFSHKNVFMRTIKGSVLDIGYSP